MAGLSLRVLQVWKGLLSHIMSDSEDTGTSFNDHFGTTTGDLFINSPFQYSS
jgi:hypothetical protein